MTLSRHKEKFEIIQHPIIVSAIGAVILIAAFSMWYYINATRVPLTPAGSLNATSTTAVTGSGTVEPSQNPNLSFLSGGRVASVQVHVGSTVETGSLLASLDTSTLSAQRAGAQANLDAEKARLAEMMVGARGVDIQPKQTAVTQARTTLDNLYANASTNVLQSYDKAFSGFSQYTDSLFNQANTRNPSLVFLSSNSQVATALVNTRVSAQTELSLWQGETNSLSLPSDTPRTDRIDTALAASLSHLQVLRTYNDQLLTALSGAVAQSSFPPASISAAQISVGAYRDTINGLITGMQVAQQQIAGGKLAVQSAQDAVNQVTASSTPEQITAQNARIAGAQASVDSVNAQIRNAMIVAPFSGAVASVQAKVGDIVPANTPAIALNPRSALQIAVYLSEREITKVHVGDSAQVTLDAYGNTRSFDAQVVSVDAAPSQKGTGLNSVTGYKTTLQFVKSDPAITSGMTANVSIPVTTK